MVTSWRPQAGSPRGDVGRDGPADRDRSSLVLYLDSVASVASPTWPSHHHLRRPHPSRALFITIQLAAVSANPSPNEQTPCLCIVRLSADSFHSTMSRCPGWMPADVRPISPPPPPNNADLPPVKPSAIALGTVFNHGVELAVLAPVFGQTYRRAQQASTKEEFLRSKEATGAAAAWGTSFLGSALQSYSVAALINATGTLSYKGAAYLGGLIFAATAAPTVRLGSTPPPPLSSLFPPRPHVVGCGADQGRARSISPSSSRKRDPSTPSASASPPSSARRWACPCSSPGGGPAPTRLTETARRRAAHVARRLPVPCSPSPRPRCRSGRPGATAGMQRRGSRTGEM